MHGVTIPVFEKKVEGIPVSRRNLHSTTYNSIGILVRDSCSDEFRFNSGFSRSDIDNGVLSPGSDYAFELSSTVFEGIYSRLAHEVMVVRGIEDGVDMLERNINQILLDAIAQDTHCWYGFARALADSGYKVRGYVNHTGGVQIVHEFTPDRRSMGRMLR